MSRSGLPKCRNRKCNETLNIWSGAKFCPACKYIARRSFAIGAFIVGVLWGVVQLLIHLYGGAGR